MDNYFDNRLMVLKLMKNARQFFSLASQMKMFILFKIIFVI